LPVVGPPFVGKRFKAVQTHPLKPAMQRPQRYSPLSRNLDDRPTTFRDFGYDAMSFKGLIALSFGEFSQHYGTFVFHPVLSNLQRPLKTAK
jgi:hypothetical protein